MKIKWPWLNSANNSFLYIAGSAILLMALLTSVDIIFRWLFNKPIGPVFSFCETLMAVMVFAALAPAQKTGSHISVTLLTSRLKGKWKMIAAIISLVLCLVFFALMFSQTLIDGLWAYKTNTFRYGDYYRFPTWWARLFVPVGILVMIGQLVFEIKTNWSKLHLIINRKS